MRFSNLSPARQALVRILQAMSFGAVKDIEVREGEPILNPGPVVVQDIRLEGEEDHPRPELQLNDFVLRQEVVRLMRIFDDLRNGAIEMVEVRAGIPRRVLLRRVWTGKR